MCLWLGGGGLHYPYFLAHYIIIIINIIAFIVRATTVFFLTAQKERMQK